MKSRGFVFTLHDWTQQEWNTFQDWNDCQYLVVGKEVCPKTGRPHLQGYVYYKNPRSWNSVKKSLPNRCHLENAIASAIKNYEYCSKDGEYYEYGEMPKQGNRTDIQVVKQVIRNGGGMRLTISKYYLPSGKSISEVGITPDIIVEEDDKDFLINSEKDNQLNYAIELFNS